jgi:hypothetical protein
VNNLAEIRKREGDCRIQGVKWITAETKSSRLLLAMLALLRNQTMKLAKVGTIKKYPAAKKNRNVDQSVFVDHLVTRG